MLNGGEVIITFVILYLDIKWLEYEIYLHRTRTPASGITN